MIEEKISQAILFLAVLFAVIIVVSNVIGFFWLNSAFILAASIVIAFILFKKFKLKINPQKEIFLIALLLLALLAYPIILITGGYPSSIDAISTSMLRILDGRIPLTHEPYTAVNLSYALGSPLVGNVFSEVINVIPQYLWPWMLGLIAGLFQIVFFSLLAAELFKNKKAGVFAATLFLLGKLVFENFYVGEMAWYLATGFMLCFLYLHLKSNKLQYLMFPVVFATHPITGFNLLVFMGIYELFYKQKITELIKLGLSLVLVLPLIAMAYLPIAYNLLFNRGNAIGISAQNFIVNIPSLPFWVGTGLTIVFAGLLLLSIKNKKIAVTKEQKFCWALFFTAIILFGAFTFLGFMLSGKIVELIIFSMTLLCTGFLIQTKLDKKKTIATIIIIILVAMVFFATSSKLEHYREGSKISPDGIEFAKMIYEFDKEQKTVLFLTKEGGKMAEYSNKLPYDVTSGHTIVWFDFVYFQDNAFKELKAKQALQKEIFEGKEVAKISDLNVSYIVTNKNEFSEKLNYPLIIEYKSYVLYRKS